MASGIDSLLSATARAASMPPGPGARSEVPRTQADHPSVDKEAAAGRAESEEGSTDPRRGEMDRAEKETLVSLLKQAEAISLASRTVIYYARDEQSGRMYLYVKDRRTGEELYRIPKDYLPMADAGSGRPAQGKTPKVDLTI